MTEKPVSESNTPVVWGSDVVAETIRALGYRYIALVPGSSFRGLHDSLVNHLGNHEPKMVVCLHEEHAVSIADGFSRVAQEPMAVALHANVGVMHASMAIFNAWCDRRPMLIVGATGPVDARKRRPWIDWIHTAQDQGALVRHFIKWDAQPASIGAAQEALLRAKQIATTAPQGPVYVCFDAALQESKLAHAPAMPDPARYLAPPPARPADEPRGAHPHPDRDAQHVLAGDGSRRDHAPHLPGTRAPHGQPPRRAAPRGR